MGLRTADARRGHTRENHPVSQAGPGDTFAPALTAAWMVASGLAFAGVFWAVLFRSRVTLDEGWYLHAALNVTRGRLPYRDFAFFQAPLAPLLHALAMPWLGHDIPAHRLLDAIVSLVGILSVGLWTLRRAGRSALTAFLTLEAVSLYALYTLGHSTNWPLAVAGVGLSIPALNPGSRTTPVREALAGALQAIAVGARHSFLGVAIVSAIALLKLRGRGSALRFTLAFGLTSAAVWGPFAVLDLRALAFNIVGMQLLRGRWVVRPLAFPSLGEQFLLNIASYPAMLTWAGLGLLLAPTPENLFLALAGVAAWAPYALTGDLLPGYLLAALPFFAALGAKGLSEGWPLLSKRKRLALVLVASLSLALNAVFALAQAKVLLSPPADFGLLRDTAAEVKRHVGSQGLMAGFYTPMAFQAGAELYPGWEMSIFSYVNAPVSTAKRFHLLNPALAEEAFAAPSVKVLCITDLDIAILRDPSHPVRGAVPLGEGEIVGLFPALRPRLLRMRVLPRFSEPGENVYVLFLK